jgi:hypothetical protein
MPSLFEILQHAIIYNHPLPSHFLKQKTGMPPSKQIEIYAHAYKKRLLGVLEEDYPETRKRLGKKRFRELVDEFVAGQPPRTSDLAAYSLLFAQSLRHKHNQLSAGVLKLIAIEAAELEIVEMEFLPPFEPTTDMTEEQLLELRLMPQPASVMVGDQFHYRLGGKLFHQTLLPAESEALQQLAQAPSLAVWIDQLPASSSAQVLHWLGKWIMHGMLCLQK